MAKHRTLLRVEYVGANDYGFVIPAIDPEKVFYFNWRDVPTLKKIVHGERLHAMVNLEATTKAELDISDWEFDESSNEE